MPTAAAQWKQRGGGLALPVGSGWNHASLAACRQGCTYLQWGTGLLLSLASSPLTAVQAACRGLNTARRLTGSLQLGAQLCI